MVRKVLVGAAVVTSLACSGIGVIAASASGVGAVAVATTPISLGVDGTTAFALLGHWCGGIGEKAYGNGFDASNGYATGDVYVWTTCSGSGRGGHSTTYSAWVATEWDYTGALVAYSVLTGAPAVNPTFSQTDAYGNQLYNSNNLCYLSLAAGFVFPARVTSVVPNSGPQGSTVTINGTGFTGATAIDFGSTPAPTFTITSSTSLTAVTPGIRTGTVDVTVVNAAGSSAISGNDQFTFLLTPRLASISPNHGTTDGGTKVKITGVNFMGATSVRFGGVSAKFKILSTTTIVAVAPPGADSGVTVDVTVTSAHGTSAITASDRYLYSG